VNPTRSAMMSSTRSTISSIVVLFSSINYMSSASTLHAEGVLITHAKVFERCPCRPDRCLSGWYHHERLLGDGQSRLQGSHKFMAMFSPPDPRFVDLYGVRRCTWLIYR
jgi:hypothetical protein